MHTRRQAPDRLPWQSSLGIRLTAMPAPACIAEDPPPCATPVSRLARSNATITTAVQVDWMSRKCEVQPEWFPAFGARLQVPPPPLVPRDMVTRWNPPPASHASHSHIPLTLIPRICECQLLAGCVPTGKLAEWLGSGRFSLLVRSTDSSSGLGQGTIIAFGSRQRAIGISMQFAVRSSTRLFA